MLFIEANLKNGINHLNNDKRVYLNMIKSVQLITFMLPIIHKYVVDIYLKAYFVFSICNII